MGKWTSSEIVRSLMRWVSCAAWVRDRLDRTDVGGEVLSLCDKCGLPNTDRSWHDPETCRNELERQVEEPHPMKPLRATHRWVKGLLDEGYFCAICGMLRRRGYLRTNVNRMCHRYNVTQYSWDNGETWHWRRSRQGVPRCPSVIVPENYQAEEVEP